MECEICGTPTNNPALQGSGMQSTGILDHENFNTVVWLCDNHAQEFRDWLRGEENNTLTGRDLEMRLHATDSKHEFGSIDVGGHTIQVSVRDGDPYFYLHDHAMIRIEGEHKDEVTVVVGKEEFPTDIVALTEQAFQERYK